MTPSPKSPRASNSRSYSTLSFVFAISEKSEMVEGCMVIGASCAKPSNGVPEVHRRGTNQTAAR